MGDGGGKDRSRRAGQQCLQGLFLGSPAGEGQAERSFLHAGDHAGSGLSYSREDGDLPGGALSDTQGSLFPGDGPGEIPQADHQIVGGGAEHSPPLQDGLLSHGLAEGRYRLSSCLVFSGVEQASFRRIQMGHTRSSFLCFQVR